MSLRAARRSMRDSSLSWDDSSRESIESEEEVGEEGDDA